MILSVGFYNYCMHSRRSEADFLKSAEMVPYFAYLNAPTRCERSVIDELGSGARLAVGKPAFLLGAFCLGALTFFTSLTSFKCLARFTSEDPEAS